jgi:hypothetical protein
MSTKRFNSDYFVGSLITKDVLSVFKDRPEKSHTIMHGMSVNEISDIVSEKVIEVVKEQFRVTKEQFQGNTIKAKARSNQK